MSERMSGGEVLDRVSKITARITGKASGLLVQRRSIERAVINEWIDQLEELVLILRRLRGEKV